MEKKKVATIRIITTHEFQHQGARIELKKSNQKKSRARKKNNYQGQSYQRISTLMHVDNVQIERVASGSHAD